MEVFVPPSENNPVRIGLAISFVVMGAAIGFGVLQQYGFLWDNEPAAPFHFDRFLWSLSGVFIGFGVLAFKFRTNPTPALVTYTTYYLPLLMVFALLVTASTFWFEPLKG
jgi:hypothetical protein